MVLSENPDATNLTVVCFSFSLKAAVRQSTSLNVWGDKDYLIAPSILSADFAQLGAEVDNVLAAGADVVHFDVMDNHYVPNLTIGPMVCKALRDHGVTAPIDVHLMVSPVDAAIADFISAGASYITFHPEATNHVDRSLQLIKNAGLKAGLVFNPATSLDAAKYVLDKLDVSASGCLLGETVRLVCCTSGTHRRFSICVRDRLFSS